jgi:hypothetical protein
MIPTLEKERVLPNNVSVQLQVWIGAGVNSIAEGCEVASWMACGQVPRPMEALLLWKLLGIEQMYQSLVFVLVASH